MLAKARRIAYRSSIRNIISRRSPPPPDVSRFTIQAIRQAGQRFQADFLSTVLSPVRNGNGNRRTEAGVLAMHERRTPATLKYGQHPSHSGGAGNGDAGFRGSEDRITSPVDEAATAKWDALQRLQSQNLGLGTAAEHQLGRALELCRDIRGWKVDDTIYSAVSSVVPT